MIHMYKAKNRLKEFFQHLHRQPTEYSKLSHSLGDGSISSTVSTTRTWDRRTLVWYPLNDQK